MILAGDVGGTKTILALWETPSTREPAVMERYLSRDHASLDEIVDAFLQKHRPKVDAACFGIAGPVKNGRCEATNLPWIIDTRTLAPKLGVRRASMINDLEANAHGIAVLHAADVVDLNPSAREEAGNRAIISAGTGLGEAGLHWNGTEHEPFACEGGHTDFSPKDETEIELLRFLAKEFTAHVSWERVVSGPGLFNVYRFLRDTGRGTESAAVAERLSKEDRSAVVSSLGLAGGDPLCVQALDLFVSLYGAEAGNLALKTMSTGGLYVGGGVAPKNLAKMKDGTFMKAFLAKGRMRPLLEAMPVRVILNDKTALLGAARFAAMKSR